MTLRISLGALCLAALANAGCALPQNSPLEHISKIQPVLEPRTNVLPPAERLMHPGPGVDGPGPGVMLLGEAGVGVPAPGAASQVIFAGPDGMMIAWDVTAPGMFDSEPLIAPGRFNFPQGAIYRLKLTNIPGREGVEL